MLPLKFLHLQSGCSLTSTYTPIARPVRDRTPHGGRAPVGRRDAGRRNARPASRPGRRPWAKRDWISCEAPTVRPSCPHCGTQLRLARERGLPVVLHCVGLRAADARTGGLGTPGRDFPRLHRLARAGAAGLAKGYCLSFGERTFASPKTLAALRGTPLSQLFLETDDSPVPIAEIYARAAEAKGVPEEVLQRAILDNYKRIFTGGEYEGPGRTKGDK